MPVCSVGVHKARAVLPQLVRDAEAGRMIELTRGEECAWLVSPDLAARAGWDLAAAPGHGIADARKVLGDLVTRAAAGIPQLLRRHKRVVVALVPTTVVTTIPSMQFPAPVFVADLGSTAATVVPQPAPAAAGGGPASDPSSATTAPTPEVAASTSRSARRLAPLGQALAAVLPAPASAPTCACRECHPRWSCGMLVLVEDAAEAVASPYVEAGDPVRIRDRLGQRV
jgi:antitoxin (DNA-binding transcriptional repressor) of toxin-antitoxin stability system